MLDLPKTQKAAVVEKLGGPLEIRNDWPVPRAGKNEVLAKVLYSGVCQSDLHTKEGIAAGADGKPITAIKTPHVGGHEGIGRVIERGQDCGPGIEVGQLVGIRFASRICRRCEYCLAGKEQHCIGKSTNHLHHEDGSFQEYIALDADYLTLLPKDVDPVVMGPVLCAGLTAYKAVSNVNLKPGDFCVISGAGGGLGHLAVQYAKAFGAEVIAIDSGEEKEKYIISVGAGHFIDFRKTPDVIAEVLRLTNGLGAHGAVVTAASPKAFAQAAEMLRIGGTLCLNGIPPGRAFLETPVATIVIKSLKIVGNLTGSLAECMEAVELVRRGVVKPKISLRPFEDLATVYEEMEKGEITGRIVLKIAKDE